MSSCISSSTLSLDPRLMVSLRFAANPRDKDGDDGCRFIGLTEPIVPMWSAAASSNFGPALNNVPGLVVVVVVRNTEEFGSHVSKTIQI